MAFSKQLPPSLQIKLLDLNDWSIGIRLAHRFDLMPEIKEKLILAQSPSTFELAENEKVIYEHQLVNMLAWIKEKNILKVTEYDRSKLFIAKDT